MTGHRYPLHLVLLKVCAALLGVEVLRFHASISVISTPRENEFSYEDISQSEPSLPHPADFNQASMVERNLALGYLKSRLPTDYHSRILLSAEAAVQPL